MFILPTHMGLHETGQVRLIFLFFGLKEGIASHNAMNINGRLF
jgi:hypothetical protein